GAFDWRNAQIEFDCAIELNPNLAWAYEIYAWFLGGVGRLDEAIAKDKKAIELDPLNSFFQSALAYFLYHARRYDDAIVQIKKTLELDPASTLGRHFLGCCLLWKGDTAGAIAEFQRSKIVVTGAWYQGLLGYAYAISGDRPKAEQILAEFFAGVGLMRIGLERRGWKIAFANDICEDKYEMYAAHFEDADDHFVLEDIHELNANEIPTVTLATASFPCNNLC